MSERFHQDLPDFRVPDRNESFQHLPGWLADRLLRPDEKVAWVRGPQFNPSWERYVTHPALVLLAIAIGAVGVGLAWLIAEEESDLPAIVFISGVLLVVATIMVLGIANGHFTRLVATDFRLVILQGHEICRSWNIDDLPRSLLRYGWQEEQERWNIDWNAVNAMLGSCSDKFTDTKAILSFGKKLDRITIREQNRR